MRSLSKFATIGLWIALLAPLVIEISSFRTAHLWSQAVWLPEGLRRFEYYVLVFAGISSAFALFMRRYFLPVLLGGVVICSVAAVGPTPVVAVLLFVFSATILGRLVFGRLIEGPLAFLSGIAIWILAMTCTLRFPIHYPATYWIALALPVAIAYPLSLQLANQWLNLFRPKWRPSNGEFAGLALVALAMGAHWLMVLKPEVSADGLAMHMAIASNIAIHHAFTIDFRQFIWALMPMGADWCYSVAYVLGGEYAARLLNFAVLGAIGLLLFGMARRLVSNAVALLMVFLFLSTPLVQLVTSSLFVENFVTAMTLAAAVALVKFYYEGGTQVLLLTAFLLGTAVALKLGALAVVVVILPFFFVAMWLKWRGGSQRGWVPICALVIFTVVAAVPYVTAYLRSGNPIFPFKNARFHSPYVGDDLLDVNVHPPLTWRTPVLLTFRTSRYFEGQNGSFGLQYFLFLPLTLASLFWRRSLAGWSCAVVGVGGGLAMIVTAPNPRYVYPALPFLTLGAAFAMSWLQTYQVQIFRACIVAAVAAGLWNTYYLPSSGWYHKDFFTSPLFSAAGRQSYLKVYAPVRELIAYINRVDPSGPVVFTGSSSIAGLIPPVNTDNWHDYRFWKQVQASPDPAAFHSLLAKLGVRRLIVEPSNARETIVDTFLAKCGQSEYSVSGASVVRVLPDCLSKLQVLAKVEEVDPEPLRHSRVDETDRQIILSGNWTKVTGLPSSYRGTLAFSDAADAQVRFNLVGQGFRYIYARASNFGMAEIVVDGERKAIVNLYDADIVWQMQTTIAGLPQGRHQVAIRALRQKDAAASGYYIDIDSIEPLP